MRVAGLMLSLIAVAATPGLSSTAEEELQAARRTEAEWVAMVPSFEGCPPELTAVNGCDLHDKCRARDGEACKAAAWKIEGHGNVDVVKQRYLLAGCVWGNIRACSGYSGPRFREPLTAQQEMLKATERLRANVRACEVSKTPKGAEQSGARHACRDAERAAGKLAEAKAPRAAPVNRAADVADVAALVAQRNKSLAGADLHGRKLKGASLAGVDLSGANLANVDLEGADLSGANLSGANLTGANLLLAKLRGATLAGARLSGVKMVDVTGVTSLKGADLSGTFVDGDIKDVVLDGAKFDGATVTFQFRGANVKGALWAGVIFDGPADFTGMDLSGLDLRRVRGRGVTFNSANLSGARLEGASLVEAWFLGTNLTGTKLMDAALDGAHFDNETIMKGADFSNASLCRTDIEQLSPWTTSTHQGVLCK